MNPEDPCLMSIPGKVILIMTVINIDGEYTTEYKFKNIFDLKYMTDKFICKTYENNTTFLELRQGSLNSIATRLRLDSGALQYFVETH